MLMWDFDPSLCRTKNIIGVDRLGNGVVLMR